MGKSFAERLRLLRGKASRESFAKSIGISPRALANYEYGDREPKGNVVGQISAQLGVSPGWLLTGEGEMYAEVSGASPEEAKNQTRLGFYEGKNNQHVGFIDSNENKNPNGLEFSGESLVARCLSLAGENADLLRQNGDLRVQVERQRARIAELERQLAEALNPSGGQALLDKRNAAAG